MALSPGKKSAGSESHRVEVSLSRLNLLQSELVIHSTCVFTHGSLVCSFFFTFRSTRFYTHRVIGLSQCIFVLLCFTDLFGRIHSSSQHSKFFSRICSEGFIAPVSIPNFSEVSSPYDHVSYLIHDVYVSTGLHNN